VLTAARAAFKVRDKHRTIKRSTFVPCGRFDAMDLMTLTEIRRAAQNGAVPARVHVQVEAATAKTQREGKPYCELALADACDRMTLRVWSDHPAYKSCSAFTSESFVELTGDFRVHPQYGLEAEKWTVRPLSEQERKELLEGPADLRTKQASDWEFILQSIGIVRNVRQQMGRPISSRRSSSQISSCPARRSRRAHRANDAHSKGYRASLFPVKP